MVAPAGVNEGLAQESAKAGDAGVELAAAQVAGAVPGRDIVDTDIVDTDIVDTVAAAEPSPGEPDLAAGGLTAAPAEADAAAADPAATELDEAGPGEPGWDAEEVSRDVSPLAVVGIIVGVIALVGVAVGVLALVTHGFRPKTVITYRPAAVFGLRPGQCINSGTNALAVTVLSCARPHDAEVFAAFSLPATGWPGTSAVQLDASNGCVSRFGSYLNPQLATADLTQEYVYPNEAAWQAGERTVVCEVRAVSGRLTNSVRAKG